MRPACLSVCLSVCTDISETTRPNFTKFSARGSIDRPRVALRCISGVEDDIKFELNGQQWAMRKVTHDETSLDWEQNLMSSIAMLHNLTEPNYYVGGLA